MKNIQYNISEKSPKVRFEPGSTRFGRCKIYPNREPDLRFGSTKMPNLEPNFGPVQQSSEPNCGNPTSTSFPGNGSSSAGVSAVLCRCGFCWS